LRCTDHLDEIEQKFDYETVTVTPLRSRSAARPAVGESLADQSQAAVVATLRARMEQVNGSVSRVPLAMAPELSGLAQLRSGGSYRVDDTSLALALAAAPSQAGGWTAVVGVDDLGVEAAAESGLELARTVLVPQPGPSWLEVTAALIDVVGLVWLRPPAGIREATASRLAARLRKRSTTLLVQGDWPGCEARFRLTRTQWFGAEAGHGRLRARRATVECQRGSAPARTTEVWLPSDAAPLTPIEVPLEQTGPVRMLETVG